jgi:hypothetical protein
MTVCAVLPHHAHRQSMAECYPHGLLQIPPSVPVLSQVQKISPFQPR